MQRIQDEILSTLPAEEREALMGALAKLVCGPLSAPAACESAPRRKPEAPRGTGTPTIGPIEIVRYGSICYGRTSTYCS